MQLLTPQKYWLAFLLLCMATANVSAHRAHFGWTEITWRNGTLDITHRVHEHDAARVLAERRGAAVDLTTLKDQARFALYLESRFRVLADDQPQPQTLGAELRGNYLFVFQELKLPSLPARIKVHAEILMELFDDQVHVVELKLPLISETLEFSRDSEAQYLDLRTGGD